MNVLVPRIKRECVCVECACGCEFSECVYVSECVQQLVSDFEHIVQVTQHCYLLVHGVLSGGALSRCEP